MTAVLKKMNVQARQNQALNRFHQKDRVPAANRVAPFVNHVLDVSKVAVSPNAHEDKRQMTRIARKCDQNLKVEVFDHRNRINVVTKRSNALHENVTMVAKNLNRKKFHSTVENRNDPNLKEELLKIDHRLLFSLSVI